MASSLLNDDENNATRNTQQQQQQQQQLQQQQSSSLHDNSNNCLTSQNKNNSNEQLTNSTGNKMQDNEAKQKKQNLEQRKQELEKLLNEKSWLLQQLQKQETQILNGSFEYMNFNDFIQNLAIQYKQEQGNSNVNAVNALDTVSTVSSGGGSNHVTGGEEAILRRKPLAAKENYQNLNNNNNVLHRRQSEISNRSSEYDNYPQNDNQSTYSEGGRGTVMHGAAQNNHQHAAKAALKKRSATVAGTTAQSSSNLQMIRQQHLEQQQQQQQHQQHLLYKQQQQMHLQHYHHPQQHLFKQHIEHQVLMPHLQYATQKFYYTTLQPQTQTQPQAQSQPPPTQQNTTKQQQQHYGRYIQNKQIAQQQTLHHNQTAPNINTHQQQILLSPSTGSGLTLDNISLYSLNSNNVATLHRPAQQQQPIIVQCDKYYLSPTSHHVSQHDGGGFIKSSQNIKEYISPHNSPQHLNFRDKTRAQTSQTALAQRGTTPALDVISLSPSYMSMETIDYSASPNMRWRSQSNLPPMQSANAGELKSQSSDMLNNNQFYNTNLNPPPPVPSALITENQNIVPPPNVTQVKPFKPFDDVSIDSYTTETQKKLKPKQWLESSLDGPVIRQTPVHEDSCSSTSFNSNNNSQTKGKLSSQSLNTTRHYSMSAAQSKINHNQNPTTNPNHNKLSQSTSYLNQLDFANANHNTTTTTNTPSISQAYNLELSPQISTAYKYLAAQQKAPARPPPSNVLFVNTSNTNLTHSATPTPPLAAALSPDIRIESPVNMTIVQPATFQPYKEVTKPFEMSDFYKYSTKFRQKENNNNGEI